MSKGYTITMFINTIKTLTETDIKKTEIYELISPRGGYWSTKSVRFDDYMSDKYGNCVVQEVIQGKTARAKKLGKTAKTRLITALKNRKTTKKVF